MPDSVDRVLDQWRRERPDLDPAPMGVVGRLSRAAVLLERGIAQLMQSYGLHPGEFDLIATLRRSGRPYTLTAGALTASSMVTAGAVTNRLDRLVAKGHVTRATDPDNRRSVLIALTPQGLDLVDEVVGKHLENEERLLSSLTGRQREQLGDLLRTLLLGLGDDLTTGEPTAP